MVNPPLRNHRGRGAARMPRCGAGRARRRAGGRAGCGAAAERAAQLAATAARFPEPARPRPAPDPHGPAGRGPGGGVERVPGIQHRPAADQRPGRGRRERAVGLPFGQQQHQLGAVERSFDGGLEAQLRVAQPGVVDRGRVRDGDVRAGVGQLLGHVQGGGVADVVGVRFEGRAQHGDAPAVQPAAAEFPGGRHRAGALVLVDAVHRGHPGVHRVDAQRGGLHPERADVLGQAAAAEAEARRAGSGRRSAGPGPSPRPARSRPRRRPRRVRPSR